MENEKEPMAKEPMEPTVPELSSTPAVVDHKKFVISKKMVIIAIVVIAIIALCALAYRYKRLVIAATVNGSTISRLTVIKELEKVSGKNVLNALIEQKLITDEALKKNITVSQEEIDAEIAKIETQLTAQGTTLDQALITEGMLKADLIKQITTQKKLEKMLADKLAVADEEITQYIKDNAIEIPAGKESEYQTQVKELLRQQKLSLEASTLVTSLKSAANIKRFVTY